MKIEPIANDPDGQQYAKLAWSAWMPLMAAHPLALAQLPAASGLYRVRCAAGSRELRWIGWAPGGVRSAIERLSRQVHLPIQPYDDPSGPALILWQERTGHAASFEVSGAAVDLTAAEGERVISALRKCLPVFSVTQERQVR